MADSGCTRIYPYLSKLTKASLKNEGRLRAALTSYSLMQLHRLNLGRKYPVRSHFSVMAYVFLIGAKLIVKKIRVKNIKKDKTSNKALNLALWLENYQYPEVDDEPFKEVLRNEGFEVKDVSFRFSDVPFLVQRLITLGCDFFQEAEWLSKNIAAEIDNFSESEILNAIISKECIYRIVYALVVCDYFVENNVSQEVKKLLVFSRHHGDVWPVLSKLNDGFSSSEESKVVLLSHAGIPVSVPVSTVGEFVDEIWAKTDVSADVFINRVDCDNTPVYVVGDPRVKPASTRNESVSQCGIIGNVVTFALTESANEKFFENQTLEILDIIRKFSHDYGNQLKVIIKRRSRRSLLEGVVSCLSFFKKHRLLRHVTSVSIVKSVSETSLAIVFSNPKFKMVSSVALDYVQGGVPVIILLPDDYFSDSRDWKTNLNSFSAQTMSFSRFKSLTEKGELHAYCKEFLSSRNDYAAAIYAPKEFRKLLRKTFNRR